MLINPEHIFIYCFKNFRWSTLIDFASFN